jgi:hypothetical protein
VKLTFVTGVAAAITTLEAGFPAASFDVATLKVLATYVPAAGLVIPAMVRVAAVEAATEQICCAFWSFRVTVTVLPETVVLWTKQCENPVPRVTVGEAGTLKAELKATVMVSPVAMAPAELVVNPTVQVAGLFSVWGEPEKVTLVTLGAMDTAEPGLAVAVSLVVFTLKVVLVYEPAAGLVSPEMVRVAVVELATEQEAPLRVMVTVVPVAVALGVQLVNPLPRTTVGEAGTEKAELKTTVILSPAAIAPVAVVLNETVQSAVLFAVWGAPVKVTFVTAVAAAMTTAEAGVAAASLDVTTLKVPAV